MARQTATLMLAALLAVSITGCGSDDEKTESNAIDVAFVEAMIPHHSMAVRSAQYQYENGNDRETKDLALEIVNGQTGEVGELYELGKQVNAKVDPDLAAPLDEANDHLEHSELDETTANALKTLGLTAKQAGMNVEMHKKTDRAFAAAMIPHHEGAIEMAKIQIAKGSNPALKQISQNIVTQQTRELVILEEIAK